MRLSIDKTRQSDLEEDPSVDNTISIEERIAEKQVRKQLRIAEKQVQNTTVFDNYLLKSKSAQTVHDLMSQDVDEEIAAK